MVFATLCVLAHSLSCCFLPTETDSDTARARVLPNLTTPKTITVEILVVTIETTSSQYNNNTTGEISHSDSAADKRDATGKFAPTWDVLLLKDFQLQGFRPWTADLETCYGPGWGHSPQIPNIGSRSCARQTASDISLVGAATTKWSISSRCMCLTCGLVV